MNTSKLPVPPGDPVRIVQVIASVAARDGGPSTVVASLHRALASAGHHSLIVSTDADGARARLSPAELEDNARNLKPVDLRRRSRPYRLKNSWGLPRAVWRASRHADIILIHGVYLAHSVWSYWISQIRSIPYVVMPHGALEPYQQQFGRRHKALWDLLIGRRILRDAAAVIAADQVEADNLATSTLQRNFMVVPLGVVEVFPERPNLAALDKWLSVPREERVLYLGRLTTKKQPELLVDAWSQLHRGQLLIVGPEQEWTRSELAKRYGSPRQALHLAGSVSPAEAAWLMDESGIFVLPSLNENFAITIAEAMWHRCAVVTTRQAAASRHVRDAGGGIVLDGPTATEVAHAIESLLDDSTEMRAVGERGRAYAAAHLTWAASAAALVEGIRAIRDEEQRHRR